uniref:Peroxin-13 n=1 Tax=Albugo laibachii Nc14 TaxID=890382 RepID=F0WSX5_9STRA|nr:conserved hypothetical protein [Albugo laibachii Nc14]|eukprot:CCA24459.1 conserved hypothetical protein [Albugo laibachii Nc14]
MQSSSPQSRIPRKPWERAQNDRDASARNAPSASISLPNQSTSTSERLSNSTATLSHSGAAIPTAFPQPSVYGPNAFDTTNLGPYGYSGMGSYNSTYGAYGSGFSAPASNNPGYNSAYPRYGSMFSGNGGYGSMYSGAGGYGAGLGRPGPEPGFPFGWLSTFNHTVSAIGQVTELLGMNAEALQFCIGSFVHFIERIGLMSSGMLKLLAPRTDVPLDHPQYAEEEEKRLRRVRTVRTVIGITLLALIYKLCRWRSGKQLKVTRPEISVADLDGIYQETLRKREAIMGPEL